MTTHIGALELWKQYTLAAERKLQSENAKPRKVVRTKLLLSFDY